jgi:peptide/nickel transport system substrate-binding protein
MKKSLALILAVAMVLAMWMIPASAETTYNQAPMFDELVANGELPPVEERLPEVPRVTHEILDEYLTPEIGNYGGTLRLATQVVNWDADGFIGQNEALLTMASAASDDITPNIVENYEVNDDQTEFTFTLRKGLKWSDGEPVTMEDFRFTIEDVIFNEELTPVIAAYMRDGGVGSGDPFTFEIIDDWTFKLSFKEPYGGFAVHLSIAGWKGYTDLLKPAHFLKPFHPAYAEECHGSEDAYWEFLQAYGNVMGYDDVKAEGIWVNIFNQVDCTNWELTDPTDQLTNVNFADAGATQSFPVLYGWVMKSSEGGITTWERNPYYFKVDAAGNQLPYIDRITSTLVEDMQMVQLKYTTGEADFARESATIDNITLYKENEATANITAYVTTMHNNPTDISLNQNYGLNQDGTLKDDDESKAWQEVIGNHDFREALTLAIDAEEILDTVYKGFGEINENYPCTHDIDRANELLDGMGMVDINGDGYRETPSGLPFQFQIWNYNEANDIIPVAELCVEFWSEIGIKAEVYTTESTLLSTSQDANEIPCRVAWVHTTQLWHYLDWFIASYAPWWNDWVEQGGLQKGEIDGLMTPPEDFQEVMLKIQSLMTVDPETAVNEVLPEINEWHMEHLYLIEPLINVQQCVVINSDIGNVPTGGIGIGWNFSFEQLYYNHPEEH